MKKKTNYVIIAIVVLALFIIVGIGMQLAIITSNCTMEGYSDCWYDGQSYNYGHASANARPTLGLNTWLSSTKYHVVSKFYWVYIDKVKVGYSCIGDKAYYTTTGFSSCDKHGCDGIEIPTTGTINLASYEQKLVDIKTTLYIQCWDEDYDYADNGDWAYAWGWSGISYGVEALGIRIAQCYDDIDCGANKYCINTGDYTTWHCSDTPVIEEPVVEDPIVIDDPIVIEDPVINVTPVINDTEPIINYTTPIDDDNPPAKPVSIVENIKTQINKLLEWIKRLLGGF